jgi:hypothetical protein
MFMVVGFESQDAVNNLQPAVCPGTSTLTRGGVANIVHLEGGERDLTVRVVTDSGVEIKKY